jgi:Lrp/AsnC family transcriptional regulator, leucine-responsive regulatory protein
MQITNDAEKLLDETGWELLCALQENARLSYADLGRRVGLTPPAVADRLRRLETAGIITGYHAAVDPGKLGLGLTAIIRFQALREPFEHIFPVLQSRPEIVECHRITGEDCMTLKVVVSSVTHLQELIATLAQYGSSNTSIILSSPMQHRPIGSAALRREALAE